MKQALGQCLLSAHPWGWLWTWSRIPITWSPLCPPNTEWLFRKLDWYNPFEANARPESGSSYVVSSEAVDFVSALPKKIHINWRWRRAISTSRSEKCKLLFNPFPAEFFLLEFLLTWNCVSLARFTTSSEEILFTFDKMEVNDLLI